MSELICLKCGAKCKTASCPACASREFKLIKADGIDKPTLDDQRSNRQPHNTATEWAGTIDRMGFAR